ncbi:MAG: TetR/AcrR family transcriptional regulator [Elusimicrobiota bacterium]
MPRPKGDADARLLRAGLKLSREKSFGAVSVREACRRAKVNLGLFHYHFKNRESFRERILEAGYQEFFSRLTISAGGQGDPPERLRKVLRAIARFSIERRRTIAGLLKDALNGDRQVARFAARYFPHHLPIVLSIYREGLKKGRFRKLEEPLLLSFLMGSLNAPGLMMTLFDEHDARRPFDRARGDVERVLLSDASVGIRLDMIMAALAVPRGAR